MKKKILITGGAGYIGSHTVVELFLSGYMPIIIDNLSNTSKKNLLGINKILETEIPYFNIDCTNFNKMNSFFEKNRDISACIHFAAFKSIEESFLEPKKYLENNIGSTEVLLNCMKKIKNNNLIFSSSCSVYGKPDSLPVVEKTPFKKGESPYAESKQKCELLINKNICNSISLRYFNPIGCHESALIGDYSARKFSNLIPIISDVVKGKRSKITIHGNDYKTHDGTCIREYIHVQDLANAHVAALNFLLKTKGKFVFNVGAGMVLSVLDIIKAFEKYNNVKVNYKIGKRRRGDVEKIYSNCDKISNVLKWKSSRSLSEALTSAWKWHNF